MWGILVIVLNGITAGDVFRDTTIYLSYFLFSRKKLKTKQMKYYNPLVDKEPIEIKVIQYHKERVEITRDLKGNAGFWVNKNELL